MAISISFAKGIMALRAFIVLVIVLGANWTCEARDLLKPIDSVLQMETVKSSEENLCSLCKEFATEVLDYLEDNSTQATVVDILYQSCSTLRSFEEQCTSLVDYYVPLVFSEISTVEPKPFCQNVNLCGEGVTTTLKMSDKCTVCQQAIAEILAKLKDPDTELEIIELLLKACNSANGPKNVQKCKRLVFKYGPLILENAPQVLEKLNLCKAIRACKQKDLHSVS